jgi:hypothetical protein
MVLPLYPAASRENHLIRAGFVAYGAEVKDAWPGGGQSGGKEQSGGEHMGGPNTARAAKDFDIEAVMRSSTHELSASALAYMALALGVILTLVWFVSLTWIFALLLG